MTAKAIIARRRVQSAIRKEGVWVTVIRVTRTAPPASLVNPPSLTGLVVNGAQAAGLTSLSLRATRMNGRFIAGDRLTIGANTLTVASDTAILDGELTVTLSLTAPLPAPVADGAAATLLPAAAKVVRAKVDRFPTSLIDGQMILATDHRVRLSALDVEKPTPQDIIRFADFVGEPIRDRVVITCEPAIEQGYPLSYSVQVR